MADDNIQRASESVHPTAPATGDEHVTNTPRPTAAGGGTATAPAGGPTTPSAGPFLGEWGAYAVKYVGVALAVGVVALFVLKLGLGIDTRRAAGLSALIGVLSGVAARAWLGRGPSGAPAAAATGDTRADVSNSREVIETVVFVVVLVLLLKSFVAEAFVIPTGSMATTLYGYQKEVKCAKCNIIFPVNCSQEVDPQEGDPQVIVSCVCPNCREVNTIAKGVTVRDPRSGAVGMREEPTVPAQTGDRVLVAKFIYDLPWRTPQRLDVVVFKYPEAPQKGYTPLNYIKRLIGLPGESIAIYYGKLYVLDPRYAPKYDDTGADPLDLWKPPYMHMDDPRALDLFRTGQFDIIRKPPDVVMAERRLVYNNDHPASDVKEQRWQALGDDKVWELKDKTGKDESHVRTYAHAAGSAERLEWLRYRHVIGRNGRTKPELITDFMGYNTAQTRAGPPEEPRQHWVGDLMIDCEVNVDKPEGQLVFELSRGTDRFRALFDLASGDCTLKQIKDHKGQEPPADDAGDVLKTRPTELKKRGTYRVRFANVDNRLLVWVDDRLPFEDEGVTYTPSKRPGPYPDNDLQPAGIGVRGAGVTVGKLQLWRDTYYTQMERQQEEHFPFVEDWGNPPWDDLRKLEPRTYYVQPGHYLCMGDNSPHSSDSRIWGTVPDRLMLGRALVVYYPLGRVRPIE